MLCNNDIYIYIYIKARLSTVRLRILGQSLRSTNDETDKLFTWLIIENKSVSINKMLLFPVDITQILLS